MLVFVGQVWAQKRSSICVYDCLSGFLISAILAYLLIKQQINMSMKAIQIFRVTMSFIGMYIDLLLKQM